MNGPRVTPQDLMDEIIGEHYFTAADGVRGRYFPDDRLPTDSPLHLLTFCILELANGFTVVGKAACVTPENFDEAMGRHLARKDAESQLWPLLGFSLADAVQHKKTKRVRRFRCAESGEFVTPGYADAHPGTTVAESVRR